MTTQDLRIRALELAVDVSRSHGGDVLKRAQQFFDFMFNTAGQRELAKGVDELLAADAAGTFVPKGASVLFGRPQEDACGPNTDAAIQQYFNRDDLNVRVVQSGGIAKGDAA